VGYCDADLSFAGPHVCMLVSDKRHLKSHLSFTVCVTCTVPVCIEEEGSHVRAEGQAARRQQAGECWVCTLCVLLPVDERVVEITCNYCATVMISTALLSDFVAPAGILNCTTVSQLQHFNTLCLLCPGAAGPAPNPVQRGGGDGRHLGVLPEDARTGLCAAVMTMQCAARSVVSAWDVMVGLEVVCGRKVGAVTLIL
jgi:hypothetical protein